MRSLPALALTLVVLTPALAAAQVDVGTVEVTGATGLTVTKQTISAPDSDGDLDVKNASGAGGLHYYFSKNMSLGFTAGIARLSLGVDGSDVTATALVGGPQLRLRMSSERTTLVLVGGAGVSKLKLETSGSGLDEFDAEAVDANGWYWEAGADASIMFRDNLAFNIGARYSTSKSTTEGDVKFDTSGISIGVGFSFFLKK